MDRRVVAGLACLVWAGGAGLARSQTEPARDPSAQPPVGLAPIPVIGDSVNNSSLAPNPNPYVSRNPPTNPLDGGPRAKIPRPPVLTLPVSMAPLPPIHQVINRSGASTGRIAAIFRKPGPPPAPATPVAASFAAGPFADDPAPRPSPAVPSNPDGPSTPPAGRPAPYSGRVPETARPQADPKPIAGAGRPAPLSYEVPRSPRPRAEVDPRAATPRPQAEPSNPPAYRPDPSTNPAPPPASTPPLLPDMTGANVAGPPSAVAEAPAGPPPVGTDPLQGSEPIPAVAMSPPPPQPAAGPIPEAPPPMARVDPEVKRTSQEPPVPDEAALRLKTARPLQFATRRAAAVGNEIITFNELDQAVVDQISEVIGPNIVNIKESEYNQIRIHASRSCLNHLIDEALILQEAKRKMGKNAKAEQQINETVEKIWKTDELPPLFRKYAVSNVHELKAKLADQGKSYDLLKEKFRKKFIVGSFLSGEIRNKVTCDLYEQKAYYNEHLDDFVQPERMTWRQIEVHVSKNRDRAAARKKADDLLARLLHDENFEALARSGSDGPTAKQGGVYVDMQPGSYGIPAVNDALDRLPIGQVSRVIEAPYSFHIVRVDSRREKGPLRFDEVQDKIRDTVSRQNHERVINDYISKLRAKTLVRTMFDPPDNDPNAARRADPAVRRASAP